MCCRRNFISEWSAPCESGALLCFVYYTVGNGLRAVPCDVKMDISGERHIGRSLQLFWRIAYKYSFKYRPV